MKDKDLFLLDFLASSSIEAMVTIPIITLEILAIVSKIPIDVSIESESKIVIPEKSSLIVI